MTAIAKRIAKSFLACAIAAAWVFSGWPQIYNFPPEVQHAYATAETFTTGSVIYTSSVTWIVPTGVTSVTVEAWGGGGAGGGNTDDEDGGGGGGGGAYSIKTGISVTPDQQHTVTVGTGGTGVSVGTGNPGNDSIFYDDDGSTVLVKAKGGSGGAVQASNAPGAGGAGGAEASGVGDAASTSGGGGGIGRSSTTGRGGPGGASGGTAADGTDGETTWAAVTGENAVAGGGPGGNGGTTGAGNAPGIKLGGGGGGAGDGSGADLAGGDGGVGAVRITYTYSWTAPAGVNSVQVEVWGGGGGGGGQNLLASDGGGGGGGGAYAKDAAITVVAGNTYAFVVGAGGPGGIGVIGTTGGDSYFIDTSTVMAKGGSPGDISTGTPPEGGAGGAAGSSVGDGGSVFSGGQGGKSSDSTTGRGGYGGSSAGTAADGWSGAQTWDTATYPTGSTPSGGGHGGDGGGSNAASGSAPASGSGGGGGGGAEATTATRTGGGAGADGKVIITYTVNAVPTLTVDEPDGTSDTVNAGDNYNIQYDLADSDSVVTVAFYYDSTSSGLDGAAISGACATAAEGTDATCSWDTTGVTAGSYYVYGIASDGVTSVNDYSPGQITINAAAVYSVTITSSGVVEYGFVELSTASSTVNNGYTQTAQNDGDTAKFNVKSSDATGGTTWTLASSIDNNVFKHEFSTTTGTRWDVMPNNATYVTANPSVAVSGTVTFDFRLTTPSASTDYQQKSITITVQAVAP